MNKTNGIKAAMFVLALAPSHWLILFGEKWEALRRSQCWRDHTMLAARSWPKRKEHWACYGIVCAYFWLKRCAEPFCLAAPFVGGIGSLEKQVSKSMNHPAGTPTPPKGQSPLVFNMPKEGGCKDRPQNSARPPSPCPPSSRVWGAAKYRFHPVSLNIFPSSRPGLRET